MIIYYIIWILDIRYWILDIGYILYNVIFDYNSLYKKINFENHYIVKTTTIYDIKLVIIPVKNY